MYSDPALVEMSTLKFVSTGKVSMELKAGERSSVDL